MVHSGYVLVLGRDLTEDSLSLGPNTILRLQRALTHSAETGETIVVAAGWSPTHPNQIQTMAEMMRDWLISSNNIAVVVLHALQFNSRGELEVFLKMEGAVSIITAPWHHLRVRLLVRQIAGRRVASQMNYVDSDDKMSPKDKKLEPKKLLFLRIVPPFLQPLVWRTVTRILTKRGVRLSY